MNIARYTLCLITFVSFFLSFAFDRISDASPLEEYKEALKVISDFANEMCDEIPLEGEAENVELSGEAKAELHGMLKKLATLGIKGAGTYQKSGYEGVIQKDLAGILKDSRDCKLEIFNQLKSIILGIPPNTDASEQFSEYFHVISELKSRVEDAAEVLIKERKEAKFYFEERYKEVSNVQLTDIAKIENISKARYKIGRKYYGDAKAKVNSWIDAIILDLKSGKSEEEIDGRIGIISDASTVSGIFINYVYPEERELTSKYMHTGYYSRYTVDIVTDNLTALLGDVISIYNEMINLSEKKKQELIEYLESFKLIDFEKLELKYS